MEELQSSVFADNDQRERLLLASYAMHSADSAGRAHPEPPHSYRGLYQRDRDRILHSGAFRRLSDKTQVFTGEMGDYHRTRLTHTLEVASIARTMARALRLNEDLVEALALAHDLGHPPFGHSGEQALDECLAGEGGFNHNAQALRICEVLESRYRDYPGLNLTREVLDGQRQRTHKSLQSPPLASPLLEVQVVDAADSIAYDAHDADDALEVGLVTMSELLAIPMWREAHKRVQQKFGDLDARRQRRAIVYEIIDWQVNDALTVAAAELVKHRIASVADVRSSAVIVRPSAELSEKKSGLERFLFDAVYHHPTVLSKRLEAQQALREMFAWLICNSDQLPTKFRQIAEIERLPRAIGDYLAGMTDRFALELRTRIANG